MSIRNLIVSIAIACLMGCGAYRSTRPPVQEAPVGQNYVGFMGEPTEHCEVEESPASSSPSSVVDASERWLGKATGRAANVEEARAFGESIGATRCSYKQVEVGVCGTGMSRAALQSLKPSYHTEYHYFAPAERSIVRGFPPEWAERRGLGWPRGSMVGEARVELSDQRSERFVVPQPSETGMIRIGDMEWHPSDEPFKERLVDFARYLGADAVWIVAEAPPNGAPINEDKVFVRVRFYRSGTPTIPADEFENLRRRRR